MNLKHRTAVVVGCASAGRATGTGEAGRRSASSPSGKTSRLIAIPPCPRSARRSAFRKVGDSSTWRRSGAMAAPAARATATNRHVHARGGRGPPGRRPERPALPPRWSRRWHCWNERITQHATVRIEIPLPPDVVLVGDPTRRSVILNRGTPTTMNTPALDPQLMYDTREPNLQRQAFNAIAGHAQNTREPTALELDLIKEFQQTDSRFFSSEALRAFANGGPPPQLPPGTTESERRGRAMFDNVPFDGVSTRGICNSCHSGTDAEPGRSRQPLWVTSWWSSRRHRSLGAESDRQPGLLVRRHESGWKLLS